MKILRMLFKLKKIKMVDFYLNVAGPEYLEKFSATELKDFITLYLQQSYVDNGNNLAVVEYIDLVYKRKIFSDAELEELMINSKFFNSMPNEKFEMLIKRFYFCSTIKWFKMPKFITFLTSHVKDIDKLLELVNSTTLIDLELVKKMLIDGGRIDALIRAEKRVSANADKLSLGSDIVKSGLYSLNDFEVYCLQVEPSVSYFVKWIREYYELTSDKALKNKILNLLLDFARGEEAYPDSSNRIIDVRSKRTITGYDYYMYQINNNGKYSDEMKEILAKKIMRSDDKKLMWACLEFLDTEGNLGIIDKILEDSPEVIVMSLSRVNTIYLEYMIQALNKQDINKVGMVLALLETYIDEFKIERLDIVISLLASTIEGYQVPKSLAIKLIKRHSGYTLALFRMYDYTEEERKDIYNTYKNQGAEDACAIYGAYLASGDKSKLEVVENAGEEVSLGNTRARRVEE